MGNLPRFLVDSTKVHRGKFKLYDENQITKIRNVLRLKPGDRIELFDGQGKLFIAVLDKVTSSFVSGEVEEKDYGEQSSKLGITLAQALTRSTKIDDVVRQNTEIGVSSFIFFESDHSIVKLSSFNPNKIERWKKIAQESARQSERNYVPEIHEPIKFDDFLSADFDVKILLHSRSEKGSIDIKELKTGLDQNQQILLIVGPEGGFSPGEIKKAVENDFKLVYLNLPILRTETAGLVAASFLLI